MSHPDAAEHDEVREVVVPIPSQAPPEVSSKSILRGQREITILHGSDRYRLRITTNDKLILTK